MSQKTTAEEKKNVGGKRDTIY